MPIRHQSRSRPVAEHGISRRAAIGGALSAICFAASSAKSEPSSGAPQAGVIRFGLTPVFLSNDLEVLDELQVYLSGAVGQKVQLVTQRTYQEVTALLISGNLEAAWICGYPFMKYRSELDLVATPLWRGQPLYQSYLIVAHHRDIRTFDACRGDIHAFSDPDSNSGYLVTKTYLAERGVTEEAFFRKSFFTYGHRNVIRAVASGLADSGSVDGYVWEVMKQTEPELVSKTKVLVKSDWHGFPPVAAAIGQRQSQTVARIRHALLQMDKDEKGRSVLERLQLDGFTQVPPQNYDSIANNMERVRRLG
ncbi:PhnD/SsuA/transferrin family substrate-binding protein [Brucella tritici]|uniref:substrate-binding domain-containing protein n=1 Tax=Brucella tritici TaxID=94626 RepID=UPI001F1D7436|nr:PhnD/SsuA/transferrin family substrate-binding protein [Brucella tritici]